MIRNYIKIAWRNLQRNRGYALVNIVGLAIGLACFMLIILYVRDERGYDNFHEKGDRIYRVALERKYPGRSRSYAIIPHSYAGAIAKEYPEVESACRLFYFQGNNVVLKVGEQLFEEDEFMWADTTFFELFGIDLLEGDPRTALSEPNHVVLTESLAAKFFGDRDAIGQTIEVPQNDNEFVVSGICENVPENSHLKFQMLGSSVALGFLEQPNFIGFSAYTYVLLHPDADPAQLERKFPDLVVKYASGQILNQFGVNYAEYQQQGNGYRYFLQPLPDIYLTSSLESEIKPPGSAQRLKFFTLIAILILGIAAINFMNLATARSAGRAREVGIRKTLGSDRIQIAAQFLIEAVVISMVAGIIALAIDWLALPYFNDLTGKSYDFATLFTPANMLILACAAACTGILSGIYPAFALSSFKPVQVLRGKMMRSTKGASLRNALVVFQFAISVFLIIATILVYKQYAYTQNKSLGFDKESLINLQGSGGMTPQQSETFKDRLRAIPGVSAVSGCNSQPGQQYFGMSFQPRGATEMTTGSGLIVDEGYVECMEMRIVQGRSFSKEFSDSSSVILNEAAVREMDLEDPIGTLLVSTDDFLNPVEDEQTVYRVIGVVSDFHFQSLHHEISPLFLINNYRSFNAAGVDNIVTVRLKPESLTSTLRRIEGIWSETLPEIPFRYAFLDEQWAELYDREVTMQKVSGLFSLIAIFIACLGLLALAAFTAERRMKEISVRKVLGATATNIVALLTKDFLKLVLLGILIASPVAWWLMRDWLQNFAYRIEIHWSVFVLAAGIAIVVAFLTVAYQSIKAAVSNPVKSLKDQ